MGALARRIGRHRSRLAGAAAVALAAGALAAPADAAKTKVKWWGGGGIAGLSGSLTVFTDHTAVAEDDGKQGERIALTDRRWTALTERLRAARFRTLEKRYAPEPIVPDSTYDTVRYRGREVTVWTGGEPPRRLTRLIRHLWRLHDRYGPAR